MHTTRLLVAATLGTMFQATSLSQSPPPVAVLRPEGGVTPRDPSGQVASPRSDARPPLVPVTELDLDTADPDLDGERVSVAFSEPTLVRDILLLLVRDTGLSLVPEPGPALEQTFIGEIRDLTLREALDAILDPLGLDYHVTRRIVRVFPLALDTRLYSVDYVAGRVRAAGPLGGRAPDFYADLADGVQTLLSPEGRMHLDRIAGLLQVTDRQGRLERVERYLELVLLRATRQIRLDATIVEVTLTEETASGVDWQAIAGVLAQAARADAAEMVGGGRFALTLRGVETADVLAALADQGELRVLATPHIRTMSNQPALVRSESLVGVSVSVIAQMSADGLIQMSVHPRLVDAGAADGVSSDHGRTGNVREIDTVVRVSDGDMLVMSGLLSDRVRTDRRRVPVLGRIPLLGRALTRETTHRYTTDLVIMLTPTLVSAEAALAARTP